MLLFRFRGPSARVLAIVVCLGWVFATLPSGVVAAEESIGCTVPVDAEITDGFRPPAQPWLPGNRGLTFATTPGVEVQAVRSGTVSFAGSIAGEWYVTVQLDDGRDVTYSYLAAVAVAAGSVVAVGDLVGVTGSRPFQLGYRDGSDYLDPTELLADACGWRHAVLVPVPE